MKVDPQLAATVVAIVEAGTLDGAARRLHITPSAVSQRLRSLENHLGRVLIMRTRPARPTAAGEAILRLARQTDLLEREALAQLGIEHAAGAGAPPHVTTMPLAVNADSLATWFLEPLARLTARHSLVFDLHRDDQDFTADLLEKGTVMGAVTSQAAPVASCTSSPLGSLRYEAFASPEYIERWLNRGVDGKTLARAPFVDFDRRDGLQHEWLRALGLDPAGIPRHYVPASHDFAGAVARGLGWGLLPTLQSAEGRASGALVPLGGAVLDVTLYWQQWNLRSPLLDDVAAEIAGEAARVLSPVRP